MSSEPSTPLPPPVQRVPSGSYRTQTVIRGINGKQADIEGPILIRLLLEGGDELEIPMTQEAVNDLYQLSKSLTTQP
jgi:hypothetical protein